MRTLALTDLGWALAARRAAVAGLAAHSRARSSTRARPLRFCGRRAGAIRFDAPSAGNRPGRHGLWQRPLERRRLRQAPLLLPWSEGGLREAPGVASRGERALVLPVPVEPSGPADGVRDIAAITYAANPKKKGLDRCCRPGGRRGAPARSWLVIGRPRRLERSFGPGVACRGHAPLRGVPRAAAPCPRVRLRPRREDYGIAQLEALADGCLLVTTAAPGPYAALPIARELDARLVGEELAPALRTALDDPLEGYATHAREALVAFSREAADRVVAEQLLPRLLS